MSSPEQIEEWIHEVEARPSSAPVILEYIGKRLFDLISRNEDLLAENIELRSGRRVEEYEQRIANLEYQLEMLKRQLGGKEFLPVNGQNSDTLSLLVYQHTGRIVRVEAQVSELKANGSRFTFANPFEADSIPPRIFMTMPTEELLFAFDSGRVEAHPVNNVPAQDPHSIRWDEAWLVEPRGGEELSIVFPIGKMTLFEYCAQASRRGCAKKFMMTSFENHLTRKFIGTGIKARPDRSCALAFASKEDRLILASREGFLVNINMEQVGYTAEEVLKLGTTDHIVSAFVLGNKKSVSVVTTNGKVIQRDSGWLEPADTFRTKGQAIFSQSRREAGIRCAGAAAVDETDLGILLLSNGEIQVLPMNELLTAGAVSNLEEGTSVVDFSAFTMPA